MTKDKKTDSQEAKFATGLEIPARQARSGSPASPLTACPGQTKGIKGLSALEGAAYILVSDAQGRMDEDLFDMLCEESGKAR